MDKNLPGPDHWFSEGPDDLAAWVASIHTAKAMLGEAVLRPTKAETAMRRIARRSVVAVRNVARGELLTESNIAPADVEAQARVVVVALIEFCKRERGRSNPSECGAAMQTSSRR